MAQGLPWESMRQTTAPYVPEVTSPTDTSNFDVEGSDFTPCATQPPHISASFTGHHLPFIGFTYTHNRFSTILHSTRPFRERGGALSKLSDAGCLAGGVGEAGGAGAVEGVTRDAFERRIQRLEDERAELQRKFAGMKQPCPVSGEARFGGVQRRRR